MVLKLYYFPVACSLGAHIALEEAGLAYEVAKVDIYTHTLEDGSDYYAINPKGGVPALVLENGSLLTEGVAVLQYIADSKPESQLLPPVGKEERYRVIEALNFVVCDLHHIHHPLWNPNLAEDVRQNTVETLKKKYAFVDKQLEGHDYLIGNTFTIADAYFFAIARWTYFHKVDLSPFKNVSAYMKRVSERPKVKQTVQKENDATLKHKIPDEIFAFEKLVEGFVANK